MSDAVGNWYELNQRELLARLGAVGEALKIHAARVSGRTDAHEDEELAHAQAEEMVATDSEDLVTDASALLSSGGAESESEPRVSTALDHLCEVFSLSTFERDLLLMCAGVELDARFAGIVRGGAQ